jgi:hypothetical protein
MENTKEQLEKKQRHMETLDKCILPVPSSATITDVPSVRGVTGLISSPLI